MYPDVPAFAWCFLLVSSRILTLPCVRPESSPLSPLCERKSRPTPPSSSSIPPAGLPFSHIPQILVVVNCPASDGVDSSAACSQTCLRAAFLGTMRFRMYRGDRFLHLVLERDGANRRTNFLVSLRFISFLTRLTSLSPCLPRHLCFYLATSRNFGWSQRDSSIFFTPNGTGHIRTLTIERNFECGPHGAKKEARAHAYAFYMLVRYHIHTCARFKAYTPNLKSYISPVLHRRPCDMLLWHLLTWVHPALCTPAMYLSLIHI